MRSILSVTHFISTGLDHWACDLVTPGNCGTQVQDTVWALCEQAEQCPLTSSLAKT